MPNAVDRSRLRDLMARELARFEQDHPRSRELFERAKANLLAGVPMPWMSEWAGPYTRSSTASGRRRRSSSPMPPAHGSPTSTAASTSTCASGTPGR